MKPPERFPPDDHQGWLNRARSNSALAETCAAGAVLRRMSCNPREERIENVLPDDPAGSSRGPATVTAPATRRARRPPPAWTKPVPRPPAALDEASAGWRSITGASGRGAAGVPRDRRRHRLRPDLRGGEAPPAQAREAPRSASARVHQLRSMRGMRGLRREVEFGGSSQLRIPLSFWIRATSARAGAVNSGSLAAPCPLPPPGAPSGGSERGRPAIWCWPLWNRTVTTYMTSGTACSAAGCCGRRRKAWRRASPACWTARCGRPGHRQTLPTWQDLQSVVNGRSGVPTLLARNNGHRCRCEDLLTTNFAADAIKLPAIRAAASGSAAR